MKNNSPLQATIEIVSNSKRQIIPISLDWDYVYIPLTVEEKKRYSSATINPCWRIGIKQEDRSLGR